MTAAARELIYSKLGSLDAESLAAVMQASSDAFPMLEVPYFLSPLLVTSMAAELDQIPLRNCKHFIRRGSNMYEHNDLDATPQAQAVVNVLHGRRFLAWLEAVSGVQGLIPDPHLTGAGYVKSFAGDSLQIHSDFNWCDQLKLHRAVSLIIYLNRDWDQSWGGALNFYAEDRTSIINSVLPGSGNLFIWRYHPLALHGYPSPMTCPSTHSRKALRLFYYTSNALPSEQDPPHRSLYWTDAEGYPCDDRSQR